MTLLALAADASGTPPLLDLARAILVGAAGVILGMAFLVVTVYARTAIAPRAGALPRHVAMIASSYCILIGVTAATQVELLLDDAPSTWRLPFLLVAYALGVAALRLVLRHVARAQASPRRRRSDP